MPPTIAELAARHRVTPDVAEALFNEGHAVGRSGPRISAVQPKAKEIPISRDLYFQANKRGISFSALLEELDPSDAYGDYVADAHEPSGRRLMDAFERQLMVANIRTKPDHKNGIPAHTVERFYMSDSPASPVLFPEFINRTIRAAMLEPSVLDELVAIRTQIDGDVYRSFRLVEDATQTRLQRVTERAEPRRVSLIGNDEVVRTRKFGVVLDMSYEVVRRMQLDLFAFHIQRIAQQDDLDRAAAALDVIINGDGNASTAATVFALHNDLGGVVANGLDLKSFIKFAGKWRDPYALSTIVAQEGPRVDLLTMSLGSANIPFAMFQQVQGGLGALDAPRPVFGNLRTFVLDNAPAGKLVGIDRRRAVQMLSETGADLTETDKIIAKQINEVVITTTSGFSILDPLANKVLDLTA